MATRSDIGDAKRHLRGTDLRVADVRPQAMALVDRYRDQIEVVARALHRRGELDGDDLTALVHDWDSGWR